MEDLYQENCTACTGKEPALDLTEINVYYKKLVGWELASQNNTDQLKKLFYFQDFKKALDFTVKVGQLAELNNHHPTIITEWGKVTVLWWTHKINGLHKNDFIMAAKTDLANSEL